MDKTILKKQKIVSLILVMIMVINVFTPFSILIPNSYAATVVPEKPTIEFRKNLTVHPFLGVEYLSVDVYFKGDIYIYGLDTKIKYDSSKIQPAWINFGTFQFETTDNLANAIGATVKSPYTMYYAPNQSYLNIAEESIRVVFNGGVTIPNPANEGGEFKAFSIMFKLQDGVTDEDLTKDMFSFMTAPGITETGLFIGYDGDNITSTNGDTTVIHDTSYVEFVGFAEGAKTITEVSVATNPTKTEYNHGDNIDLSGGKLTVSYSDGTSEEIDMTSTDVTIKSGNPATVGNNTVEIEYKGQTTNLDITVNDPVASIEMTTPITDREYTHNENVNFAGGVITATTNSGVTSTINLPDSRVTSNVTVADLTAGNVQITGQTPEGFDRGLQTGTLTYEGKTTEFDIIVNDSISSISVSGAKNSYDYGEEFDKSTGTVNVTTGSGQDLTVALGNGSVSVTNYDKNTLGEQTLTVEYLGQTTTYNVTVNDFVESIEVANPTKTTYEYGDTLDLTGGTVREVMASGAKGTPVELTESMVSGYNANRLGVQDITVTYNGMEDTFGVTVTDKLVSIEVVDMKTTYNYGEALDFTNAKLKQNLASGNSITLADFTSSMLTSTYNPNQLGEQVLNIADSGVTGTLTVNVLDVLDSIEINNANKPVDTYGYGESVSRTGEITANYTSSATQNIALSSANIKLENSDGSIFNTEGVTFTGTTTTKNMTIKYTENSVEKSVIYPVTIVNTITGIAVQGTPKNPYNVNESFQNDLSILVSREQGTPEAIVVTESMISGFDTTTEGTRQATITYVENGTTKITTFSYTVTDAVTGIVLDANPDKTTYNYGEDLDLSGATLEVTKGSGKETIPVTESMISGYDKEKLGLQKVTISYDGKQTTFDVTVVDYITGVTITPPTKTSYEYNEDLVLDGGTVTPVMASGATASAVPIETSMISNYSKTTVGNQTVTVEYEGQTGSFDVTVNDTISSIEVTAPTGSGKYNHGGTLDLSGATITVNYASGATPKTVTPTANMVFEQGTTDSVNMSPSTYDSTNKVSKTVTLSYTEDGVQDAADFEINIVNNVTKIEMHTTPKVSYNVNETLDVTGGEILVTRAVGTPEVIAISSEMISGFDSSVEASNKPLTVTYIENEISNTTSYNINVVDSVTSVAIKGTPKTEYNYGEDLEELTITAVSGSGSKDITVTESMISGYDKEKLGSQTVTILYGGQTTTFNVTVNDYITGLTITPPTKTSYKYNEDLVLDGGTVTPVMASGATVSGVPLETSMISNYSKTTLGDQAVTVLYQGQTGSFDVTVNDSISSIDVTAPTSSGKYNHGGTLDLSGATITVNYASGATPKTVTPTANMVFEQGTTDSVNMSPSTYDSTNKVSKTVTLSYTEDGVQDAADFEINIVNNVTKIEMHTTPKVSYNVNETLDVTGGEILVTRAVGTPEVKEITSSMVTGFDSTVEETAKELTVTYVENEISNSTTYTVSIIDSVSSIAIKGTPKTTYNYGEDLEELTITAVSGSGSKDVVVTDSMIIGYDKNTLGNQTVTISYGGQTTTFDVTVVDYITGITVTPPTKTNYAYNEDLVLDGGKVTTVMASGATGTDIELTDTNVTISGYSKTTLGEQIVTVEYEGHSGTFNVTVGDKVSSIDITPPTGDGIYNHGETLDLTGAQITVNYASGATSKTVTPTANMVFEQGTTDSVNMSPSTYDSTNKVSKTVTLSYTEDGVQDAADFEINIVNNVTKIEMHTTPKVSYNVNETLDVTGGEILVTRAVGTPEVKEITSSMVTGFDSTVEETAKELTVTYVENEISNSTTYTVSIIDSVSSIAIKGTPKTTYNYGEDLEELTITAVSGSGSKDVVVTDSMIIGYDKNVLGNQTVTISYGGQTTTFDVTVIDYITGITVTAPTKVNYVYNEDLVLDGGKISTVMASGAIGIDIGLADLSVTLSGYSKTTVGDQTITVTYQGHTGTFGVNVNDDASDITLVGTPKTEYEYNEDLDVSNLSIQVVKPSGTTTVEITDTNVSITGYDKTKLGSQTVVISYNGTEVGRFNVNVKDPIEGIEMGVTPKTSYVKGEALDITNGTIIVNRKSGAFETVNITESMVTGFDSTSVTNSQILTVTYSIDGTTYTTSYNISVVNPVKSIRIDTLPKTTYNYGEALDVTGGILELTLGDDSTITESILSTMVTELDGTQFNPNKLGTRELKVTYGDKEVTYEITVNDYVSDITFVPPTKVEYNIGEDIDLSGGFVQEVMASGEATASIPLTDSRITVISFDNTITGAQTVKLLFNGEEFTYQITIADAIASVVLDSSAAKKMYKYGESLDVTGLILKVTKSSGTVENIDVAPGMVSGFDSNELGNQTVKVSYNNQEFTYDISVEDYLTGYELVKPSKLVYELNQNIDLAGAKLIEKMASGVKGNEIVVDETMISGFESNTTGSKVVKVKYNNFETEFTVVINDNISGIKISSLPNKTEYKYGESLDLSGGTLEVQKESGNTEKVDMNKATVTGYNPNKLGNQTVKVTYEGKTVEFTVKVVDYVARTEFIAPTKVTYSYGEDLDLTGGKIREVMASGAIGNSKDINAGMLSGFNNKNEGKQVLTVTDNGKTFTYSVVVIDKILSVTINKLPTKLQYQYNEEFDAAGGILTVTKQSGTSSVTMTNSMVTGYDKTKSGNQTLTVNYAGYVLEFTVSVGEKPIIPVVPDNDDDDIPLVPGTTDSNDDSSNNILPIILGSLALILGAVALFLAYIKFRRNVRVYLEGNEERILIGKERLSMTERVLDLSKYYDKYHEDEFEITLSKSIVKKINNKQVQVIVHNKDKDILVSMKNHKNTYKV